MKERKEKEQKERLGMEKQFWGDQIKKRKCLPAGVFGPGLAGWGFLENIKSEISSDEVKCLKWTSNFK